MSYDMDQFKDTYITECYELLEGMEESLLGLEEGTTDIDALNAIFRCAHSIKGGGGAFGFSQLVGFTHVLEALLDSMREGRVAVTREGVDALLRSVDIVTHMVTAAKDGSDVPDEYGADLKAELTALAGGSVSEEGGSEAVEAAVVEEQSGGVGFYEVDFKSHEDLFLTGNEPLLLIRELMRLGDVDVMVNVEGVPDFKDLNHEKCYISWRFEVSTDKGIGDINEVFEFVEDSCDLSVEEFAGLNLPAAAPEEQTKPAPTGSAAATPPAGSADAAPAVGGAPKAPTVTSIRVDLNKVDNLVNMVGEMVITQAMIVMQTQDLPTDEFSKLIQGVGELTQHTRELQEAVMAVRMQPVKSVFSRMPRIVRDLSSQLGKDIKIEMSGEATEIDKTVIEQLSDPLTHMIRNSVDHGVEIPEERIKAGKPGQGVIHLTAGHSGGRIVIEVWDDGAGINRERVLSKAIEKGVVPEGAQLTDEEVDNLIFNAGFSTAAEVTDVSGRGVGMDVVRSNIQSLGGTIELKNTPGKGSRFTVSLPLTLAILDGMIVRVAQEDYIIPINNIIESMRPKEGGVKQVADGDDVINVRGQFIPILYLHQVFNIEGAIADPSKALVVLVENGRNRLGIVVDELVGQQQVVMKNIEENTDPIEGVGGATILGDGNVALILDITELQGMIGGGKISGRDKKKQVA